MDNIETTCSYTVCELGCEQVRVTRERAQEIIRGRRNIESKVSGVLRVYRLDAVTVLAVSAKHFRY